MEVGHSKYRAREVERVMAEHLQYEKENRIGLRLVWQHKFRLGQGYEQHDSKALRIQCESELAASEDHTKAVWYGQPSSYGI